MCPVISWCNSNEGFFSLLVSIIAVFLSIIAIRQTKIQIKMNDKQQNQNVSLTLFPMRKNILQLFSEEKYSELLWDAQILFDNSTFSEIKKTKNLYDELKELHTKIEEYESKMAIDMPDLYDEYRNLLANIEREDSYEIDGKSLYDLCESYSPVVNGETICFKAIYVQCIKIRKQYVELQKSTIELIKEEIKKKTT